MLDVCLDWVIERYDIAVLALVLAQTVLWRWIAQIRKLQLELRSITVANGTPSDGPDQAYPWEFAVPAVAALSFLISLGIAFLLAAHHSSASH